MDEMCPKGDAGDAKVKKASCRRLLIASDSWGGEGAGAVAWHGLTSLNTPMLTSVASAELFQPGIYVQWGASAGELVKPTSESCRSKFSALCCVAASDF